MNRSNNLLDDNKSINNEDRLNHLMEKIDKLYRFRDYYFETHLIEDASKKNDEIEKQMNECLNEFTDNEDVAIVHNKAKYYYLKGRLLNVLPKYCTESEMLLSKAIKLDPKFVDAWNELGECYWKNDELEKAVNCFERALKEKKNKVSLRSLSMLTRQQVPRNRENLTEILEKGLNYAKEAVQIDPSDGLSWVVLGNAHLSTFFGVQQNPKTLKQCLSAYSQAEKDVVAKSTPDLHYNKGITLKYEEQYELALESFNKAIQLDPGWQPPKLKEQQLLDYLNEIEVLVSTRGKTKKKRLQQIIQSINSNQLGPLKSNDELTEIALSDLKSGLNQNKIVLGKVVCSVRNEDTVPFTFCMVDKSEACCVITVYNLADGKGVIIGDAVAIPEPHVLDIDFSFKDNAFKFRSIRVETPLLMIINGKKVNRNLQAGVQMSIFRKFD